MAKGLEHGRASYKGAGAIGQRDESFANRAAAAAPRDGWFIDTPHTTLTNAGPTTAGRCHFYMLPSLDRDYELAVARFSGGSSGAESQSSALYVYKERKLTRLPGSLVTGIVTAGGILPHDLPQTVTLQAGKRYFVASSVTAGTGNFYSARQDVGTGRELPYLDIAVPPTTVDLLALSKERPLHIPYVAYLSKEAALVL